jgi:membrane-associated protein
MAEIFFLSPIRNLLPLSMDSIINFFDILFHSEKLIQYGGLALLLIIVYAETGLFFGFIFPGDALLFTAGLLCGSKDLDVNIFILVFSVVGAAVTGNLTGYLTGRILGKKIFSKENSLFFKKRHLEKTRIYYNRYGSFSLIAGRFIPVVRTFVPILAGAIEMNHWKFNLCNVSGALLWGGSLVPFGYFVGRQLPSASDYVEYFVIGITTVTMTILIRGYLRFRKNHF